MLLIYYFFYMSVSILSKSKNFKKEMNKEKVLYLKQKKTIVEKAAVI